MDLLAESAARVTVLGIGVALGLRALHIRSPRLAHRAWTSVVVVMLMLPLSVAWGLKLAVSVLPAGVGLFLLRLAIGLRRAQAIRRGARQVRGRLTHPSCVTPMTIGMLSPVVILPADWVTWSDADLSAVVAHEEEHVHRRDPLVAGLTLLNRAIFWFHPLVARDDPDAARAGRAGRRT